MRVLAFFTIGLVLGYLYFSWMRQSAGSLAPGGERLSRPYLGSMLVRLSLYAATLSLIVVRFGAPAAAAAILGMAVSRALMVWAGY